MRAVPAFRGHGRFHVRVLMCCGKICALCAADAIAIGRKSRQETSCTDACFPKTSMYMKRRAAFSAVGNSLPGEHVCRCAAWNPHHAAHRDGGMLSSAPRERFRRERCRVNLSASFACKSGRMFWRARGLAKRESFHAGYASGIFMI